MSEHRLLIATDVPYWKRSTGAEQRVAALVDFFAKKLIVTRTFFISKLEDSDWQSIKSLNLDVVQGSSDQPPSDRYKKAIWTAKATLFRFQQVLKQFGSSDQSGPLTLEDYRWPWAIDQFADCVHEFQPDSILIEYASLAYLLFGLKPAERENILCLVDTHDVLYLRDQQFRDRGYLHWLSISRQEEAEALQLFDVILAIEQSEARVFRELAPNSKTIVAGHSLEQQILSGLARERSRVFVVGYIGSRNFSNLFAITEFFKAAISGSLFDGPDPIEVQVAGEICAWLDDELGEDLQSLPMVNLVGRVDDLNEFYSSIDVAINPVEFGTGLKIKNCEALAHGCPLITTPAGKQGMPDGLDQFIFIVESQQKMADKIREMAHNPDASRELRSDLFEAAKVLFSDDSAYSELYDTLISSNPNQIR